DLPGHELAERGLVHLPVAHGRYEGGNGAFNSVARERHYVPAAIVYAAKLQGGPRRRQGTPCPHRGIANMPLEMRSICEKCETALAQNSPDARICSYECTFCADCSDAMGGRCPNCGGELVARPRRTVKIA